MICLVENLYKDEISKGDCKRLVAFYRRIFEVKETILGSLASKLIESIKNIISLIER